MKKLVVDTSVVVKWLSGINEKYLDKANLLLEEVAKGKIEILTINLIYYELVNALFWGKKLSSQKIIKAMKLFSQIPMTIFSYEENLLKDTLKLMERKELAFYDSIFIALAKREKCFLLSADEKHHGKLKNVLLLKDFK